MKIRTLILDLKKLGLMQLVEKLTKIGEKSPVHLAHLIIEIEKNIEIRQKEIKGGEDIFFKKNEFFAIVGKIKPKIAETFLKNVKEYHGISPENIKIFGDIPKFKNGAYTDLLENPNCKGILFGPIPHSASGSPQTKLNYKSTYALNKQGTLKFTTTTLKEYFPKLVDKIKSSP